MITKELLERINALARKQRENGLTDEEKEEQSRLRQTYLAGIRSQVIGSLEAAGYKPKAAKPKKAPHDSTCDCSDCRYKH
ncbi:MAG: DUF896 domain-containing protein [Peptococcaceae bacterium]|nr:DUF896 domain-containing protein [Candidatus Syntrophopropionicum ammoniitolerans]